MRNKMLLIEEICERLEDRNFVVIVCKMKCMCFYLYYVRSGK